MSTTIDQRVVEMRFDNRHFEENVSTTMSTLDKLKQKLNLTGASKGLENINTAAKNVNMTGLGNGVEYVTAKFSALQVMGVTALANITNSAINAGKNIVKSLTIDPIKSGFSEYETKMGSIQTILANTEHQGTTLDDVTAALDELNTYADKTIYNFQQMTKNIGTFTAAGVDLDTSVRSIQGIANLAAISGSTSQQASTAMYQLSQALASGTVKLQDWNSVVNAGMGGKVFQNALIRTAAMLDGAADDVEAWQKKNVDKFGSFRESLTQGAWLTTEVLTATLEQFTMAAEEGSEEWETFKKSLMSSGYTEKQAEEILKMANTATDAATKVKTFTQLLDTLKESAQSGWAQTWELIVGDFEEAKAFFTELSDLFGGIIGKSADRRNTFIGDALTSNWDKLIGKINEAGIETSKFEDSIRKVVGEDKLDALIQDWGSLEKAVKNGGIASDDLKKALDGIISTSEKASFSVDKLGRTLWWGKTGEDVKQMQSILKELGYDLGKEGIDGVIGQYTSNAIRAFQKDSGLTNPDGIVGPKTIAALKEAAAGLEGVAKGVDKSTDSVDKSIDSWKELIDEIDKTSGRELLLKSLMNVINAIHRPLQAVGEAWRNTFSISSDQLYNALVKLEKFTGSFTMKGILDVDDWKDLSRVVEGFGIDFSKFEKKLTKTLDKHGINVDELIEKYGDLGKAFEDGAISFDYIKEALLSFDGITESLLNGGEAADKVRRTFEGLFAILDIIATVMSGPIKFAFKIVSDVLSNFGISVLDFTAKIGDSIVGFRDKVDEVIDSVTKFIADNVTEWIKQFKETEFFKTCAGWIDEASETITEAVDSITEKIDNFSTYSFVQHLSAFGSFLGTIANSLSNSEIFITIVDGVCAAFGKLQGFFSKFKLPEFNIDNMNVFSKLLANFEGLGITSLSGTITELGNYFMGIQKFNWETFKNKALEKFVAFWLKTGDKIKAAFEACSEVANAIKKFIFGAEEVNLPNILSVVEKFLGIIVLIKTLNLLNGLVAPLDNVTDALNNFASAMKWNAIGGAFKAMAWAIGVFAVSIVILTQMDIKDAWQATGMLILLIAAMATAVTTMAHFVGKIDGGIDAAGAAASLLILVGAIALLVFTIKAIDKLELNNPVKTFTILFATILALTAGIRMVSKAAGSSFKSVAAILTLMAALNLVLDVIDAYDKYDWSGKTKAIWHMVDMLAVLSIAINVASRGVKENASARGLALLLLAMVLSLKILLGVIEDFAAMPTDTLLKGGAAVVTLMGVMAVIMFALGEANKATVLDKGQKAINSFAGLATALIAVVAAIWLLGKMDTNTLLQGGLAVTGILLLFTHMLSSIGNACAGIKMGTIIVALVGMAILMAEMYILIKRMQDIPWQNALGSAGAMVLLMVAMSAVFRSISKVNVKTGAIVKWIGAMTALSGVLMALAYVLNYTKDINPANSIGNVIALSGLMAAMSGVIITLTKHRNGAKSIYKWIGAMATLALVVGELALVLHIVKDINPANAIGNAIALSTLLLAMTASLAILSKCKVKANFGAIGAIAVLGLVAAELSVVMQLMRGLDPASVIPQVLALSILVTVLSLVLIPLSAVGKLGTAGLLGVGTLATLAASLFILVGVLATMTYVTNASANAKTLAEFVTVLSLVLIPLTVVGAFGVAAIAGVGVLATMMVSLFIVVGVLATMQQISNAQTNANILIDLLSAMGDIVVKVGSLGFDALTAIAALGGLLTLITRLGSFVTALGWLSDHMSGLEGFLDTGLELFKKVANGLGEIISEFGVGLTSGLPEIGTNLSKFASNLFPFVITMRLITDDVVTRAENLAKAIGSLLKADFIGKFTPGELDSLGTELSNFATNAEGFITKMSGIKPEVATGMESFCNAVNLLIGAAKTNAWADFWHGEGTLTNFGATIKEFAGCIDEAAEALVNITDEDVENIKKSATAGEALADLAASIPSKDGLLQGIVGSKDLVSFGESIVAFADCLVAYSEAVSGKAIDAEAIKSSAEAGTAIADLNNAIPKQGGWAQEIMGAQDLASFGEKIVAFAKCLTDYSAIVAEATFNSDAITKSANAAEALATLNGKLPSQNGLYQAVMGEQDLGAFGTNLISFANGIVAYANAASTIDETKIESIKNSGKAIDELLLVMDKIPESGGWGDAIFGSNDPLAFGNGIKSIASGISSYCSVAASITQEKIDAIKNSGKAISALGDVVTNIPDGFDTDKTAPLWSATNHLVDVAGLINTLSTSGYDYTGVDKLQAPITTLASIVNSTTITGVHDGFITLKSAVQAAIDCADLLKGLNSYTYKGIDRFKEALTSLSGANVDGVVSAFSGKDSDLSAAMESAVNAMASTLSDGGGKVSSAMTSLIDKTVSAVSARVKDFTKAGSSLATNLVEAIKDKKSSAHSAGKNLAEQAVSAARTKYSGMHTAGKYLGDGLVDGINAKKTAAYNAGYALGQAAVQGEKDGQASNSPSKATIKAGKWLGEGLVIGMKRMGTSVYKAGRVMGKDAVGSISTSISKISSLVESGMDTQPTIRPVLDLSNVENGVGAIGSMLGMSPSVGVMSNVGAISSMMNHRGQNGSNLDVVDAINKLRKDLSNVSNNTYTINGITYDDSSNIATAMEAIVETARRARRV